MVATFIEFNFDIYIEGICLQDMLQMNHMEFIQQNVLAEGVEASYVVIRLIPILLRINVVIVDTREVYIYNIYRVHKRSVIRILRLRI